MNVHGENAIFKSFVFETNENELTTMYMYLVNLIIPTHT